VICATSDLVAVSKSLSCTRLVFQLSSPITTSVRSTSYKLHAQAACCGLRHCTIDSRCCSCCRRCRRPVTQPLGPYRHSE